MKANTFIIGAGAMALAAAVGWVVWPGNDQPASVSGKTALTIPAFSAAALEGEALFDQNCVACHGRYATGSDQGPPLVHRIYEPNHHGDLSFQRAARNGVRAHHWRFGDMPPVDGVSDADVMKITRYVRELQKANGIF